MTSTKKLIVVGSSVLGVVALAIVGFAAILYLSFTSAVMTKRSPDGQNSAKLIRVQAIDVNFRLIVDGKCVYISPDFAPTHADFREQVIWSPDSSAVVLEVANRRVFGYHVREKRTLTEVELADVQFTPFEDLGFEGELPNAEAER